MKTKIARTYPWGLNIRKGTRLLCSDGVIRSVSHIAQTADTFFSIPCSVKVKGKTISGYATTEEQGYINGVKETEPFLRAYVFRQHTKQKFPGLLPEWPSKLDNDIQFNALIASAN